MKSLQEKFFDANEKKSSMHLRTQNQDFQFLLQSVQFFFHFVKHRSAFFDSFFDIHFFNRIRNFIAAFITSARMTAPRTKDVIFFNSASASATNTNCSHFWKFHFLPQKKLGTKFQFCDQLFACAEHFCDAHNNIASSSEARTCQSNTSRHFAMLLTIPSVPLIHFPKSVSGSTTLPFL